MVALVSAQAWLIAAVSPFLLLFFLRWRVRQKEKREARVLEHRAAIAPFFAKNISIYSRLSAAQQESFLDVACTFLEEQRMFYVEAQRFDAPRVLEEVDPSLGWRIAAAAAILSIGAPGLRWASTRDILVYPKSFNEDYESQEGSRIAGMVHAQGPIIFSAEDLCHSFERDEGYNVALHELAHVLDMADAYADGELAGVRAAHGEGWSQLMKSRIEAIRGGRYESLRDYASTNTAEFFAVAVEVFFEKPRELRRSDPALFESLAAAFGFDPTSLYESASCSART